MLKPPDNFHDNARAIGLQLTGEQVDALGEYLHRLLETNKKFNLTAIKAPDVAWMRHILDSLSLLPFVSEVGLITDVGSGGGLPGIPLAIVRPNVAVTCIEATGKKAKFIEETARAMGLTNLAVVNDRAETVGRDPKHRQQYDVAIARAIGPMNVLLELLLPLVKVGGRVLAMKGRKLEEELRKCEDGLMILGECQIEVYEALPGLDDEAVIVEVTKTQPTPNEYPRRPGIPKQNPL